MYTKLNLVTRLVWIKANLSTALLAWPSRYIAKFYKLSDHRCLSARDGSDEKTFEVVMQNFVQCINTSG